ncbi:p52 [Xanthomonas phage Xop411]|uniref:p52 n=1 Tax=Xanthomonas phage Xop411 TaxID=2913975 RepID=A5H1J2_9CAUD|nr:p52 [Xanthomonas phage Xop411]ABK00196.1 p52 [Xanthomonas phage Xop411]
MIYIIKQYLDSSDNGTIVGYADTEDEAYSYIESLPEDEYFEYEVVGIAQV